MRLTTMVCAAFALGGMTAIALAQVPDTVPAGHYYRIAPKTVKGRKVWPRVNDVVDIAPLPGGRAMVSLDLALDNAACNFSGIARFEGAELVYRDLQGDPNSACQIALTAEPGQLSWRDNGRCSARCPSGALTGSVPLSHRIAARPAAQLAGYQAAVAEHTAR